MDERRYTTRPVMRTNEISLDAVKGIAERAGQAVLALYRDQDLRVETKSDGSPVTAADMASERVIEAELRPMDPSIPYLSEEYS